MGELNNACGINKLIIAMAVAIVSGILSYIFKTKWIGQPESDNSKTNYYLMLFFGIIGGIAVLFICIWGLIWQLSKECRMARSKYERGVI